MSRIIIQADEDDEIRAERGLGADDYRVVIGAARLYLHPAAAEKLRDALTAALAETEEARDGH